MAHSFEGTVHHSRGSGIKLLGLVREERNAVLCSPALQPASSQPASGPVPGAEDAGGAGGGAKLCRLSSADGAV